FKEGKNTVLGNRIRRQISACSSFRPCLQGVEVFAQRIINSLGIEGLDIAPVKGRALGVNEEDIRTWFSDKNTWRSNPVACRTYFIHGTDIQNIVIPHFHSPDFVGRGRV